MEKTSSALISLVDIKQEVLTPIQIGELLPHVENLKKWCESLQKYAEELAFKGTKIPGFKVVNSTGRSSIDKSRLVEIKEELEGEGYSTEQFLKVDIVSQSDLKKLMGAKKFNDHMKKYIIPGESKLKLVPETAPGVEVHIATASDDFKEDIDLAASNDQILNEIL